MQVCLVVAVFLLTQISSLIGEFIVVQSNSYFQSPAPMCVVACGGVFATLTGVAEIGKSREWLLLTSSPSLAHTQLPGYLKRTCFGPQLVRCPPVLNSSFYYFLQ